MAWAAVLAPAGVLIHELGHFAVARWLGFGEARISATGVTGGATLGASPDGMVALQSGAGPLLTLLLLGLAWLRLRRGYSAWAVALAATAPLRFFVDLVFVGTRLWLAVRGVAPGTPNFDEYNFARAVGLPPVVVAVAAAVVLIGTAAWLWRLMKRRRLLLLPLGAGAFAGLYLWVQFAGPPVTAMISTL